MRVTVVKPFQYSVDGINPIQAVEGDHINIPGDLVPGLVEAGFIKGATPEKYETADAGQSPENKMLDDPFGSDTGAGLEIDPLKIARDEYFEVFEKRPYHGWGIEEINEKVDAFNEAQQGQG